MALIGEAKRTGHLDRRITVGQQLARLGQAQLDQVSVGRQPEGGLESPAQPKTIHPTGPRQIVQPNILIGMGMQIIPRHLSHQRQARVKGLADKKAAKLSEAELVVNGKEEPWYAFTIAKPLKSITIPFEAKHVRPIKASPALDRCFELPSDLLFDTAQFSLSAAALARLERLAANLAPGERVARLHVHGHSDARQLTGTALDKSLDNQKLSEFRARAVGQALQRILKLEADQITSGGAGSREPLVKCERSTVSTRYELEQCNRPNRRVEIKVTLFNNGTADKASP